MSPAEYTWRLSLQKAIDAENSLSIASWVGAPIGEAKLQKFREARDAAREECRIAWEAFVPEAQAFYDKRKVDS